MRPLAGAPCRRGAFFRASAAAGARRRERRAGQRSESDGPRLPRRRRQGIRAPLVRHRGSRAAGSRASLVFGQDCGTHAARAAAVLDFSRAGREIGPRRARGRGAPAHGGPGGGLADISARVYSESPDYGRFWPAPASRAPCGSLFSSPGGRRGSAPRRRRRARACSGIPPAARNAMRREDRVSRLSLPDSRGRGVSGSATGSAPCRTPYRPGGGQR